jgi:hypothetical protein
MFTRVILYLRSKRGPSNLEHKLVRKHFIYVTVLLSVCHFKAVLHTESVGLMSKQIQVPSMTLKMLVEVACLYTVRAATDCG